MSQKTAILITSMDDENLFIEHKGKDKFALDYSIILYSENDINYALNTEFETDQMDAQMLQAWIAGKLQGVIPTVYFNDKMRKVGYFPSDSTDEDIESMLESEGMGNNNGGIV